MNTDVHAGLLPMDDDLSPAPAQAPVPDAVPVEPERVRGLTGNLCDAENALRDGKYDTPRIPAQPRGLYAAMGIEPDSAPRSEQALAERYRVPPFSVLNARDGEWQERKRRWIALGIKSELGRGNTMTEREAEALRMGLPPPVSEAAIATAASQFADGGLADLPPSIANSAWDDDLIPAAPSTPPRGRKRAAVDPAQVPRKPAPTVQDGRTFTPGLTGLHQGLGILKEDRWLTEQSGTSIFDPVLTECCYLWYSFRDAMILDPFAGGSVRGIVAALLGRRYYGVDLRAEQIAANTVQAERILPRFPDAPYPSWHTDDARNIALHGHAEHGPFADYIFTCPPYADLERYSDDPRDISTLGYEEFRAAYFAIISAACSLLKPDRFATCVIGETRSKDDENGRYYGLVPDTIRAFEAAGLQFYNEQILITMVGSLPLRTGKIFDAARKCGKTHQNVLTFVKGSARRAAEVCGSVDVSTDPLAPVRTLR